VTRRANANPEPVVNLDMVALFTASLYPRLPSQSINKAAIRGGILAGILDGEPAVTLIDPAGCLKGQGKQREGWKWRGKGGGGGENRLR